MLPSNIMGMLKTFGSEGYVIVSTGFDDTCSGASSVMITGKGEMAACA